MIQSKSTLKLRGRLGFALLAMAVLASVSHAAPRIGDSVLDARGQTVGTIAAPLESDAKLSPSVIIQLHNGGTQIVPLASLREGNGGVTLPGAPGPRNESDEAVEKIFEIRSMTMALVMQDSTDAKLLRDISNMVYDIQGDQLIAHGSLESTYTLEQFLEATAELTELTIAPHLFLREGVSG